MQKRRIAVFITACLLLTASMGMAHSGRTDSQGGHKDNKNASGLGVYHYHCGGNPPHLHSNGVCPYKTSTATKAPAVATAKATAKPAAAPDEDICYGVTNAKGVNVRETASTKAKKLHTFPMTGTEVQVAGLVTVGQNEIWCQVLLEDGREGFILAKYIDLPEGWDFGE